MEVGRLLHEKPMAPRPAAADMVISSLGMHVHAYGGKRYRYDSQLVLRDGSSRVFRARNQN